MQDKNISEIAMCKCLNVKIPADINFVSKISKREPLSRYVYFNSCNKILFNLLVLQDEELQDSIERAREMEDKYGHYFDYILVNSDMELAYTELVNEINRLEVEPQWVPSSWVGSRLVLQ